MTTRRLQGLGLVLSAVCLLIGHFGPETSLFQVISMIGTILFIIGVPAIYSVQPIGAIGLVGIVLVELSAVIALAFQLGILNNSSLAEVLPLISAIAGMVGRVVVGWLTSRRNEFPAWVGWAFVAEGLLNFLGGAFAAGSLANVLAVIVVIAGAAASFGYGFFIFQRQGR